jgi:hypothetical protein
MSAALAMRSEGSGVSAKDFAFADWDLTKPYTTKPGA